MGLSIAHLQIDEGEAHTLPLIHHSAHMSEYEDVMEDCTFGLLDLKRDIC